MTVRVFYHTATGNTRKVAGAIADELGIEAEMIGKDLISFSEPIDLLFIGDGIYAGKPGKETISFINRLDPAMIKNTAVFATYGGQEVIGERIADLLRNKGLNIIGKPYTCKGKCWFFINRRHPNENDLDSSRQFARSIVTTIEK